MSMIYASQVLELLDEARQRGIDYSIEDAAIYNHNGYSIVFEVHYEDDEVGHYVSYEGIVISKDDEVVEHNIEWTKVEVNK